MRVREFRGKHLKLFLVKVVTTVVLWVTMLASTFGADTHVEKKMSGKISCDVDVLACTPYGVYSATYYSNPIPLASLKLVYIGKRKYWEDGNAVKVVVFSKSITQKEFLLLDLGISYSRFMEVVEKHKSHYIVVDKKYAVFTALQQNAAIAVLEDTMVLRNQPGDLYYLQVTQ